MAGVITREEILMGRDAQYPLTPDMEKNLWNLLKALNQFRKAYGRSLKVSSGYRPGIFNVMAGGAKGSCHTTCEACDFVDSSRDLAHFCTGNLKLLEECGLYMEDPVVTTTWVHLQTRKPGSGSRIFRP